MRRSSRGVRTRIWWPVIGAGLLWLAVSSYFLLFRFNTSLYRATQKWQQTFCTDCVVSPILRVDQASGLLLNAQGALCNFHGISFVVTKEGLVGTDNLLLLAQNQTNVITLEQLLQNVYKLQELGFNLVKLGVLWSEAEPIESQIDYEYVDFVKNLVSVFEKRGFYVIISSYQRLLSSTFCGAGFPDWAVQPQFTQSEKLFPKPAAYLPISQSNQFECSSYSPDSLYFSYEVASAFQDLYMNKKGLRDNYISFWKFLATTFVNFNNILGYELITQPFLGDFYKNPQLLESGAADLRNLDPFYRELTSAIREIDSKHIIFYESAYASPAIPPLVGFKTTPGNDKPSRLGLSMNLFCWSWTEANKRDSSRSPASSLRLEKREFCSYTQGDELWHLRQSDQRRFGSALFISDVEGCDQLTNRATCQLLLARSSIWVFGKPELLLFSDMFQTTWKEDAMELAGMLGLPYARTIGGELVSYRFEHGSNILELSYQLPLTDGPPTEIYLNEEVYYPNGYNVRVKPKDVLHLKTKYNYLIFTRAKLSKQERAKKSHIIKLVVQPKEE